MRLTLPFESLLTHLLPTFATSVYPKKSETIQRTFYAPPGWH